MRSGRPIAWALAWLLGVVPCVSAAELDFDLRATSGYDSNAHELSPQVGEQDGAFAELRLAFSADHDFGTDAGGPGWSGGFDLRSSNRRYEAPLEDADQGAYLLRLRAATKDSKREKYASRSYSASLTATVRDSTYVSRATGVEATVGTTPVGDRFDSSKLALDGSALLPLTDRLYARVKGSVDRKAYREDYAGLGLETLDYSAAGLESGLGLHGGGHFLEFMLPFEFRRYDDRPARDASGNPLPGSRLEYRVLGADLQYEYELSRAQSFEFNLAANRREDNGQGFDDLAAWEAALGWTVESPQSRHRLRMEVSRSDYRYERLPSAAQEANEEALEGQGVAASARYDGQPLRMPWQRLRLLADLRWKSFDNPTSTVYSYDRLQAVLGLHRDF